jgi:Co/Zn/Cd efflux system component
MLGDASLYAASLFVMSRPPRWQAGVSLLKGAAMAALGLLVAGEVAWTLWTGHVPSPPVMGAVGALALAANLGCAGLLYAYRRGDLNMRSSWLCSRNDVLANLGVLGAAALVAWSGSAWPDLAVGSAIAAMILRDALGVTRDSLRQLTLGGAGTG